MNDFSLFGSILLSCMHFRFLQQVQWMTEVLAATCMQEDSCQQSDCTLWHCVTVWIFGLRCCKQNNKQILDALTWSRFGPYLTWKQTWMMKLMFCMASWNSHSDMIWKKIFGPCAISHFLSRSRTRSALIVKSMH